MKTREIKLSNYLAKHLLSFTDVGKEDPCHECIVSDNIIGLLELLHSLHSRNVER